MRSGALNIVGTFMAVEDFTDHCRKVYFATEDFSLVTFIIVNCGLYYLFQAKHIMDDNEAAASDFLRYQLICRDNLETALANLPLFMPATAHSIQALLLGVRVFQELPARATTSLPCIKLTITPRRYRPPMLSRIPSRP